MPTVGQVPRSPGRRASVSFLARRPSSPAHEIRYPALRRYSSIPTHLFPRAARVTDCTGATHMSFLKHTLKLLTAAGFAFAIPASVPGQGEPIASQVPRAVEVRALMATLRSKTAELHDKVVACHRLAIIGTKEAVPVLAGLLDDAQLGQYARHALEPMTEPSAGAALRDALTKTQGPLLVGVINSVGFRRDAQATAALARLLASPDAEVAAAAAAALGRIGTAASAQQLTPALARASGPRQLALADACLTCADTLVTRGRRKEAAAMYDRLHGTGYPDHIRTAAMCGAITAREAGGISLLVKQLHRNDAAMLAAAWRAARELPGAAVTKALVAEFARLPAEKQVQLVQVFGDRGDRAALPALVEAAGKGADPVRVAALHALPRVDDGKAAQPVLLKAITSNRSSAETSAALASLGRIGGADTDAKILGTLAAVDPAMRVKLIALLGQRRADGARAELLKLAAGNDPEIAKAAFRSLAQVARPADLGELIRLSTTCRDDSVKVPADLAIFAVSMKLSPPARRAEPVLNALRAAQDPQVKCALLRPLGAIVKATGGSVDVLDTIRAALEDPDADVRTAALRCLADWPDARPAGQLLEIARGESEPAQREVALRGGIRMAANVAAGRDQTPLDALAWFVEANRMVRSHAEKLMIVSGLGSLNRIEGLEMLQPYLQDPAVQTEAQIAVIELADSLAKSPDAAKMKAAVEKVSKTTKDVDVRRRASKMAKSIQPKT